MVWEELSCQSHLGEKELSAIIIFVTVSPARLACTWGGEHISNWILQRAYTSISEQAFKLFQGAVRLKAPLRILYMALLKMPEIPRTISSNCNDHKQSVQTIYVISGLKTSPKYTQTSCNFIASTCSQINDTSKESGSFSRDCHYFTGLGEPLVGILAATLSIYS